MLVEAVIVMVWSLNRALKTQGIAVNAVVFERQMGKPFAGILFHYDAPRIRYRFLTHEGQEIISRVTELPPLMRAVQEQDVVKVLYLKQRPAIHHLADDIDRHIKGFVYWLIVPSIVWAVLLTPLFFLAVL